MTEQTQADKKLIRRNFSCKADVYESAAVLQREVGLRMQERLAFFTLRPRVILDAGCGTGYNTRALMRHYRDARVMGLDMSAGMLRQTRKKSGWWRKPALVCADAEALPLADNSVDLVFSNLMLQWCEPEKVFAEFLRVLRPEGLLLFSSFGPDTLKELRQSWASVDGHQHVNRFVDMHVLGDALMHAGFADPVMDMDMMQLTYADPLDVMRDLKAIGANTLKQREHKGLVTRAKLQQVCAAYEAWRCERVLPASFEVVYGHAWKSLQPRRQKHPAEILISPDRIGHVPR